MSEAEVKCERWHQIFTYGTLKKGFANHGVLEELMRQNEAVFRGSFRSTEAYPMVCGLYGIPYLINVAGWGEEVRGEVYGVCGRGLARLDELEGVSIGHYERRRIRVEDEGGVMEAEAYFAHTSFGEALWKKKGQIGISEYRKEHAKDYVKSEERAQAQAQAQAQAHHKSIVDELVAFVASASASDPTNIGH